jgi:(4S)-4-hydroxy-5-phosphonooxypentane-2,3-dione isomerase
MYVVCVTVMVVPEHVEAFVSATLDNAKGTRKEPGNARFDVLRALDDPSRFFFYEVYADEAGFRAHQETPHYLAWKERVAPMMAVPRVGVKHTSVFPEPWS